MKEIKKICKIHGELALEDIKISPRKDTKNLTFRLECKLCIKKKKVELLQYLDKKCAYDNCNNQIKILGSRICGSCRHQRRKDKIAEWPPEPCAVHGALKLEDCYKYNGKYKCKKCKNLSRKHKRVYTEQHRAQRIERDLKSKFNMTINEYNLLLNLQNGVCAICKKPETSLVNSKKFPGLYRRLAVDHCHETGINRGLLCIACNSLIGSAKDNINILEAAIQYLKPSP